MIDFKDITLEDKEIITSYIFPNDCCNCELSFANHVSWRFLYQTKYAVIDDFFIILNHYDAVFKYPIHCHPEYEINLVINTKGTRVVGDSEEEFSGLDFADAAGSGWYWYGWFPQRHPWGL